MRAHAVPVLAVIVATGLTLAGCGRGSPSPGGPATGAGTSNSSSAVAYSDCMRSHGVTQFPDPRSDGQIPKVAPQQLGVSSTQLQSAQQACQRLLPVTGSAFDQEAQQCYVAGDCPPAIVQVVLTQLRIFARCMRTHGVPNFPDPIADSQGRATFDVSPLGIPRHSTLIDAEVHVCAQTMHPIVPWGEQ